MSSSRTSLFDLAIIGGGINGCGIARDAAGRGLSVLLVEQGDLAGATSSASTKLIHGGLRYLEHYAFRLVHEALAEREVLLRAAPHLDPPDALHLPHHAGLRPRWLIRTGLFLYDHLGGRKILPGHAIAELAQTTGSAAPEYSHAASSIPIAAVDDSRLVVLNARDAAARGADIRTRTRCLGARRTDGMWHLTLEGGDTRDARVLVNAAGPWVTRAVARGRDLAPRARLVKGSHIVVPRLHTHERSYILQNADGRVCFAIPYQDDFTLIGTTDEDYHGDRSGRVLHGRGGAYLCGCRQRVSAQALHPRRTSSGVIAGVRPLLDDGVSKAQEATRDYVLELNNDAVLSVFGGKITTYRRLAEAAMAKLAPLFPGLRGNWTATAALPGGDFPWDGVVDCALTSRTAIRSWPRQRYAAWSAPMARRARRCWETHTGSPISVQLLRCRPDGTRGRLADTPRMGAHRGRCAVAPEQAWPAHERGYAQRLSLIIEQDPVGRTVHILVLAGPQRPQEHRQSAATEQKTPAPSSTE